MDANAFAVIGPGRVGLSLTIALRTAGWRCVAVRGRAAPRQDAIPSETVIDTWDAPGDWHPPPLLFLTVDDRLLADVARRLAAEVPLAGRCVLHTSGLHGSDLLEPCRRGGATAASWHPLQSFARRSPPARWRGVACAVEGDAEAVTAGQRAARALGMRPWTIAADAKPLYHAAAAVAGNLPHVLVAAAREMMASCGAPEDALQPLVHESVGAALREPGFGGLTGAIARGDAETIARHLSVLPPPLRHAYEALAGFVRPDLQGSLRD